MSQESSGGAKTYRKSQRFNFTLWKSKFKTRENFEEFV